MMNLITTDEYKVYEPAILRSYGEIIFPTYRSLGSGRQKMPYLVAPPGLKYALVHKIRGQDRKVVRVVPRVIFGSDEEIRLALEASPVSWAVNTAFMERNNGTDVPLLEGLGGA